MQFLTKVCCGMQQVPSTGLAHLQSSGHGNARVVMVRPPQERGQLSHGPGRPQRGPQSHSSPQGRKGRKGESHGTPCRIETDWLGVPLPPASPMRLFEGIWGHGGAVSLPGPPAALGLWQGGQGWRGASLAPPHPIQAPRALLGLSRLLRLAKGGLRDPEYPGGPAGLPAAPPPAQPLCRQPSGPHGLVPHPLHCQPWCGGPRAHGSIWRTWRSEELVPEAGFVF